MTDLSAEHPIPDFADDYLYQACDSADRPLVMEMVKAIIEWEDVGSSPRELAVYLLNLVRSASR